MPDSDRPLLPLADVRRDLRADCSPCKALCCVAPAFAASADFAFDEPAGSRGACLIGADLRGVDLSSTDLLAADLRAADVRGARLQDALVRTRPQVEAARGDGTTTLPGVLRRPRHWTG